MEKKFETYKAWAPDGVKWAQWAKPVLFMNSLNNTGDNSLDMPNVSWVPAAAYNTMIIVDLPGKQSVTEALALAQNGYRPVPLYNGVSASNRASMIVPVDDVKDALYKGVNILKGCSLQPSSPPVFMLDSNRMNDVSKKDGKFDNRWCVFAQDMPSAAFLRQEGIKKVIVRTERVQSDLAHILCRYQNEHIAILKCSDSLSPQLVKVTTPSLFKSISYRFKVITGLRRNSAGGFGAKVPEPMESNYGNGTGGYYRGHYGIG